MPGRRITRDRKGGYSLRLPHEERELLRSLPSQMRDVMQTDDPGSGASFLPPIPTTARQRTSSDG